MKKKQQENIVAHLTLDININPPRLILVKVL